MVATLPSLGLLTVAALTPDDVEVAYREIDEVPPEGNLNFLIWSEFPRLAPKSTRPTPSPTVTAAPGFPVVLGGLHVSLMPDEAAEHADSVVLYGAEGAWPRLLEDFRAGCMKPRYEGRRDGVFEASWYAKPRFDLLGGRPYNRVTVQTSRGCPLNCEFCAASLRITSRFQQKPVDQAVAEIRAAMEETEHPFLELADDNTFINKKWGKEFLRAIIPLGLKWFTETDISVADDEELLDLLAESGCRQVLIGLESPNAQGLHGIDPHNLKSKWCGRYLESIDKIQSRGVTVNGCFIVGLDTDTPEIFPRVKEFVDESRLIEVQITVQTPFPGTPLYHRLGREGRLLKERFWDRCTLFDVNFVPKHMTVEELEAGVRWLFREIYNEREFNRRKRHYMDTVKKRTGERDGVDFAFVGDDAVSGGGILKQLRDG